MLAFVHIRKTAGSTVDTILRQSFGVRHCRVRHGKKRAANPVIVADELQRCRWVYWGMECVSGHGIVPHSDLETLYPNIRYFTFLREPLARCASDYQFRLQRGGMTRSFDEWIETDIARNHQTKKIGGADNAETAIEILNSRMGFVGIGERFNESIVIFKRWVADPRLDIRYKSKNVAKDSSIKKRLLNNPATRAMLIAANEEDLKLYQYVRDTVFPKQIAEYGESFQDDVREFEADNDPLPVLPRQLFSILVRELVYKPLAPALRNRSNPDYFAKAS